MPTNEDMQRALAAYSGQGLLDQQNADLQAQQENDALMGGTGMQPPTMSEPVMSEPAPMAPPPPAVMPSEQVSPEAVSSMPPDAMMSEQLYTPPPAVTGPPAPSPAPTGAPAPRPGPAPAPTGAPRRAAPDMLSEQTAALGAAADQVHKSRAAADASTESQASALEQQGLARAGNAQAQAELAKQHQDDLAHLGETHQLTRQERQRAVDQKTKEVERFNSEAANVEVKDRRSTMQKALGAVAIALGGIADQVNLAAGLNMGMNLQTHRAAEITNTINAAVDRDLAIQRENLQNKRNSAAAKFSELGVARAALSDVDDQEAHARAALLDKYAAGLESVKHEGIADDAVASANIAAEQMRGQAAQLRAQSDQATLDKADQRVFQLQLQKEQQRRAEAAARARANQPMSEKEKADLEGKRLDNEKKRRDLAGGAGEDVQLPGGRTIVNPAIAKQRSPEEKKAFNELQDTTGELSNKVDTLMRLRAEHPVAVGIPNTDAYQEAQEVSKEIQLALKKKHALGTLDKGSEQFLKEMAGDPNAWFINTPEAQMRSIQRNARLELEKRARNMGYSSTEDLKEKYGAVDR